MCRSARALSTVFLQEQMSFVQNYIGMEARIEDVR